MTSLAGLILALFERRLLVCFMPAHEIPGRVVVCPGRPRGDARWGEGLGCLSEGGKINDFYSHCLLFQPFLVFLISVLWERVRIRSCILEQLQVLVRAQAHGARGGGCRGVPRCCGDDGRTVLATLFL